MVSTGYPSIAGRLLRAALVVAGVMAATQALSSRTANAQASSDAQAGAQAHQDLVVKAAETVKSFREDAQLDEFRLQLRTAKAVLIVPDMLKAGSAAGAEGGRGVLLARDSASGEWGYPAFFTLGAGSDGSQAGIQSSETIFIVRNDAALERLLRDKMKLGADAGVAIATVGAGIEGSTTTSAGVDILAFAHAKGLYGGVSFEGAVLAPDEDANAAYYGSRQKTRDIVKAGKAANSNANPLRVALGGV